MSGSFREDWTAMLRGAEGREYWRSLSELMERPEFREVLAREFPQAAAVAEVGAEGGMPRRDFLKLIGASLALAGLTGCLEEPHGTILPYTVRPPEVTPGNSIYYATTMSVGGYGTGLLIESREGRPTKVEGNPEHPASLGGTGPYEQASVLQLYDPHRARHVRQQGREVPALNFVRAFAPTSAAEFGTPSQGAGLRFLLEPTASPFTAELIARVRAIYPAARFTFYSPLASAGPLEGARLAFGRTLQPQYDFLAADVIVSLDSDFLGPIPFNLRYARHFADRRRLTEPTGTMNRLYVAEGRYSVTGGIADHRLRVRTAEVEGVAVALMGAVAGGGAGAGGGGGAAGSAAGTGSAIGSAAAASGALAGATGRWAAVFAGNDWIQAAAQDLRAHAGRSLVLAGDGQPPLVHAIAHALNSELGNIGRTVHYTVPLLVDAGEPSHSLDPLLEEMRAGAVRTLVIAGANPVYDAPADAEFGELLKKVPETVYAGLYRNETGALTDWMVPGLHYLESWGDARAWDGTASIVQPLIRPLYGGMTVDDVLKVFLWEAATDAHELLWESWQRRAGAADFDVFWAKALEQGVIPGTTTAAPVAAPVDLAGIQGQLQTTAPRPSTGLDLSFHRDAKLYDGRFADNGWLQELPDPLTKQTWGNAALVSPRTAARLNLNGGDMVELTYRERSLLIPALILPGQADDEVAVNFGYGRQGEEVLAQGVGSNAYWLRYSDAPYFTSGLGLRRVGEATGVERIATTQTHWSMEGRAIVMQSTLDDYRKNPEFTLEKRGPQPSLYNTWTYTGNQWAMTIDLSVCTGCSACVVACQAENNSPVVGKDGVLRNREMHWLRIDRYFTGSVDEPRLVMQPMMCQHCEKAPCEYVCPVNATVHSSDGLNEMIYNRCVGTRFCSNNCPYKVRRFNWFNYNALRPPTEEMQLNPDVTVRARGVMEKCTYCVQRIRRTEIKAQVEGRPIVDGEIRTACQQACPTQAIIFGSIGDPGSEVSRTREQPRIYSVLHELGTQPRTQYLARINNPNPVLGEE